MVTRGWTLILGARFLLHTRRRNLLLCRAATELCDNAGPIVNYRSTKPATAAFYLGALFALHHTQSESAELIGIVSAALRFGPLRPRSDIRITGTVFQFALPAQRETRRCLSITAARRRRHRAVAPGKKRARRNTSSPLKHCRTSSSGARPSRSRRRILETKQKFRGI
jgi:hypothetical protein